MKSNVSMYVSSWDDRRVCTGSRSILANKSSLFEKVCLSLLRKCIHLQSDPRKAVEQPMSPPWAISTAAVKEMRLRSYNGKNCPMFNAYFYSSCLHFSWHAKGWKQRHRTLEWWGILQQKHSAKVMVRS